VRRSRVTPNGRRNGKTTRRSGSGQAPGALKSTTSKRPTGARAVAEKGVGVRRHVIATGAPSVEIAELVGVQCSTCHGAYLNTFTRKKL